MSGGGRGYSLLIAEIVVVIVGFGSKHCFNPSGDTRLYTYVVSKGNTQRRRVKGRIEQQNLGGGTKMDKDDKFEQNELRLSFFIKSLK